MKNIIDKDVNLFLPKKYNILLLGGNFLLSKRLYEITKRSFEIKRIDYDFNSQEEYFPCIKNKGLDIHIEPAKKIKTIIDLHNSNVLIFTSEILLFLNENKFSEFLKVIEQLKESEIRIIFVSISNPLHICKGLNENLELTNMSSKTWYQERLEAVKLLLNSNKDLIYACSSYLTYISSNIQSNIIDLLKSKTEFKICSDDLLSDFYLSISDNIINHLILKFNDVGFIEFNNDKSKLINLQVINESLLEDSYFSYVNIQSLCSVNLIYRKKPNEIENNLSIAQWRYNLGFSLGRNIPDDIKNEIDIIVPVPETGKYYAQGLSKYIEKPYVEAFYKKTETGRSFDIANFDKRQHFLNNKLGIMGDLVASKSIGIVDEAIFTGQTLQIVKKLLLTTSVKKIYFLITSPECIKKCSFNMMPERSLISSEKSSDELKKYFEIDGIIFQNPESYENTSCNSGFSCTSCFKQYEHK